MPDDPSYPPASREGFRIREARASDVPNLMAVEVASFRTDRLTPRQFAAHASSRTADLIVAHVGETLAGYALVLSRKGSRALRLYSLAVEQRFQGLGLGSALLAAAEMRAEARGAQRLRLEVRRDNMTAIRLYKARGYRLTGRKGAYYADGCPALRFEKELQCEGACDRPFLDEAA